MTAATTVTSEDAAGETVAVAIAAGAGVVAGGALAAWLFKPVPGAPPAPTQPPPFSTEPQGDVTTSTSTASSTFTTSTISRATPACPFPSSGISINFSQAQDQPQWTVAIPAPSTVSYYAPECTKQGDNSELLRGTDPEYINALVRVYCKNDLSKDQTATLGQAELEDSSDWKNTALDGVRIKFGFSHTKGSDTCRDNCIDAYKQIGTRCMLPIQI